MHKPKTIAREPSPIDATTSTITSHGGIAEREGSGVGFPVEFVGDEVEAILIYI